MPIKKSDFQYLSTLTAQQWNKMEVEFMKFAVEHGFRGDNLKKVVKKKGNELMNIIEEKAKGILLNTMIISFYINIFFRNAS